MAKVKIPKRVAGVKVPKKVRKQAKKALKLAASPVARDLALTGLALAAERVVGEAKRGGASARPDDDSRPGSDRLDLGAILHAAVAEGARRFREGFEEGIAAAAPKPAAEKPSEVPLKPAGDRRAARKRPAAKRSANPQDKA